MIMNWAEGVNIKLSLDGNVHLKEGFINELTFESGKRKTWLRNSYVPIVFPELSLLLDNKTKDDNRKTEADRFKEWHAINLRYGSLPFQIPRIGFQRRDETKTDEMGIYAFLEQPEYDSWGHMIIASFGLVEDAIIPEVEYLFLSANNGDILFTNNHHAIAVNQEIRS